MRFRVDFGSCCLRAYTATLNVDVGNGSVPGCKKNTDDDNDGVDAEDVGDMLMVIISIISIMENIIK